jgi:hypothetical protein
VVAERSLAGRPSAAENRNKFPMDELLKYDGKHVAWFLDGSGIRDADEDAEGSGNASRPPEMTPPGTRTSSSRPSP